MRFLKKKKRAEQNKTKLKKYPNFLFDGNSISETFIKN